jgi:hypothetical protein
MLDASPPALIQSAPDADWITAQLCERLRELAGEALGSDWQAAAVAITLPGDGPPLIASVVR